ncbi:putative serine carboxypeptidase CPVL [Tachypleus tridentatus]|uniref:putative serine carboxypeptidase CPVL n=1 Tax=Tachypleus tridentatus TaxID=6853 RepID=UPI003FD0D9C7
MMERIINFIVGLSLSLFLLSLESVTAGKGPLRQWFPNPLPVLRDGSETGDPLFLTPLIESGNIEKARQESLVGPLLSAPNITSYAALLTVNKTYNSNMFFWFFPALNNAATAPVLLWLQGGPGGSSLFGLFVEHGPLVVSKDMNVKLRKYTWAQEFSMLFIDNPVGTGFSFTNDKRGYATNQRDVADDLYEALQQFFTVFQDYRKNEFYITGESYAGKYVPAIAYKIHSEGSESRINLKGIAIGDGLCDPETMLDYGDFLYQIGLVDERQADYVRQKTSLAQQYIQEEQWLKAFYIFDSLLNGDKTKQPSFFANATGLSFYYNFLYTEAPENFGFYNQYLAFPGVRKAIHVGNLTYNDGSIVEDYLLEDIMKSVKPWIEILMDNYKVMIYSGQLDIIIAFPLTESFLQSVTWKYSNEYKNSSRQIWKVKATDKMVAGYVRQVHDFYQVLVRNAGHILPYDQPRIAFDMISRFVKGKTFQNTSGFKIKR